MRKWLLLLIACLALGLVVAGCGGDDDDEGGGGAAQEQPAEGGGGNGGGGSGGGGAQVGMQNIKFEPADVTINAGETVTWTNDEGVPHDVDGSGPGGDFSSGPEGGMNQGDTYEFTFEEPGTYDYVCRVHAPGMAGTVTVR
jgi:plastocyanin